MALAYGVKPAATGAYRPDWSYGPSARVPEPIPAMPSLEPIAALMRLGSGSPYAILTCACALYPTGTAPYPLHSPS